MYTILDGTQSAKGYLDAFLVVPPYVLIYALEELEKTMAESVDFYLAWCAEWGKTPEKPFSGKFMVRTSPELHSRASVAAARVGLSLNKYIEKAIEDETRQVPAQ